MAEGKKKPSYEKCLYFVGENSSCGPFKRWDEDGLFKVEELAADITNHLQTLKVLYCLYYYVFDLFWNITLFQNQN